MHYFFNQMPRSVNSFETSNKNYVENVYTWLKFKNFIGTLHRDEINSIYDGFDYYSGNTTHEIISDLNKFSDLKKVKPHIFENENNYILYKVNKIEQKGPDLNNKQTRRDIINLVYQKNKFDYNNKLLKKITSKKFNDSDFKALGPDKIKFTKLNSIRDNNMFNIDAVKILYSLPVNSFTLINDENNNIYLAKTIKYKNKLNDMSDDNSQEYKNKYGSENKNTLLKTYDLFLNSKYDVVLNQKAIERVKNFFQ